MTRSLNTERLDAQLELAAIIARNTDAKLYGLLGVIDGVRQLAKIARSLHGRYEAACSYEWANTPAYERRTERLEVHAAQIGEALGVTVEHQRDPRGWPVIVKGFGHELRLG